MIYISQRANLATTCPQLSVSDCVEIYENDRHTYHVDSVECVLSSLQHMMHGFRLGTTGRAVNNVRLHCDRITSCAQRVQAASG